MDTAQLVSEIDSEIARLQQARALLAGAGSTTHAKSGRKKRTLSAEARTQISHSARELRWAKQKRDVEEKRLIVTSLASVVTSIDYGAEHGDIAARYANLF